MRRRVTDLLTLLVFAGATAWLARGWAALPVDVENVAMKSVGTAEAQLAQRRAAEFGADRSVLLLLEPRASGTEAGARTPEVATFLETLRALPQVAALRELRTTDDGALLLALDTSESANGGHAGAVRAVTDAVRRATPPTHHASISGQAVGELAISDALFVEQRRIVPWILLALLTALGLVYRHPAVAVAPLIPAVGGILWVGGIEQATGGAIDPIGSLLAPVLSTVGVAAAVHLIEHVRARRAAGEDLESATHHAVRELRLPASLAVATTIAGLLGLLASPIPAVRRFALVAGGGVALTSLFAFVIVPPWLRVTARAPAAGHAGSWTRGSLRLVGAIRPRAAAVVATAALATAGAAWAWSGLRVDTEPSLLLPAEHPFRVDSARLGERVGGTETFELLLDPPAPAASPAGVVAFAAGLAGLPGVTGAAGLPRQGPSGAWLVPVLLAPGGSSSRESTFAAAEAAARAAGWPNAHATGPAVQVARDSGALVRGQWRGLWFTTAALFVVMALGLRSLRLAALGLLPNLVPCVLTYGALAVADRPLSVSTAMIGTVMLGMIVDDTIHLLHAHRVAAAAGHPPARAIARALRATGRAIVVTSIVLALGFGTGALGELQTTREFAVLSSGAIVMALAADLVLLPAILLLGERRTA